MKSFDSHDQDDDSNAPLGCLLSIASAIAVLWFLYLCIRCATAAQVTLAWDPSVATPPTVVGGYRVYYGSESGTYANSLDVGIPGTAEAPTYTVAGLPDYSPSFFVVSAYDTTRTIESTYSNEVCKPCVAPADPIANFTATPVSGFVPLAVKFTDTSTAAPETPLVAWAWTFGDSAVSTVRSPSHTYTTAGIYAVGLTVADSIGRSNTKTLANFIAVSVPGPAVDFTASPLSGYASLTVRFTNLTTGTVTKWKWQFGDGQSSTIKNPSHTYFNPGTYSVSLSATGSGVTNTKTKPGYITVSRRRR